MTLYASKKEDSTVYLMREGRPVVYEVSNEDVEMWTGASRYLLRDKTVVALTAADTAQVTIQTGGQSLSLALTRKKDEERSTESTDYYIYTVTGPEGQTVLYDRYSRFLEKLSALRLSGDTGDVPQGNPVFTLRYQGFNSTAEHTLELFQKDESQLFAVQDGTPVGLIRSADYQGVVQEAEKLMGLFAQ